LHRQSCSAINYLSNGINILAVPVKLGSKGTDPRQEGYMFYVSHAECCAINDSRPSCECSYPFHICLLEYPGFGSMWCHRSNHFLYG